MMKTRKYNVLIVERTWEGEDGIVRFSAAFDSIGEAAVAAGECISQHAEVGEYEISIFTTEGDEDA